MRIFRRSAPARIASPVPIKPTVPGSGTVVWGVQPPPITLLSNVTAPLIARALPQPMLAPVFRVMLVSARIFPSNAVVVPRVAELPTCQNTFRSARLSLFQSKDEPEEGLRGWRRKAPFGVGF